MKALRIGAGYNSSVERECTDSSRSSSGEESDVLSTVIETERSSITNLSSPLNKRLVMKGPDGAYAYGNAHFSNNT